MVLNGAKGWGDCRDGRIYTYDLRGTRAYPHTQVLLVHLNINL